MGIFNITIQIANRNGERFEDVEVMVDTGAVTTVIPRSHWKGWASNRPGKALLNTRAASECSWIWLRRMP